MAQRRNDCDEVKCFDVKPGYDVPLGLSIINGRFQFAVSLPKEKECSLLLYTKGENEPFVAIPMLQMESGIFSVSVAISRKGNTSKPELEYLYQAGNRLICDPYATKIIGREQFGIDARRVRASVSVPEDTSAAAWVTAETNFHRHSFDDLILYKLHVRGFTNGRESKVKKKGTFAGLTEKISYLQELGITGVLLMPVTEFDELEEMHQMRSTTVFGMPKRKYVGQIEEKIEDKKVNKNEDNIEDRMESEIKDRVEDRKGSRKENDAEEFRSGRINYWGYTSSGSFYFAPKASYASKPDKAREEFQAMVAQFHEAGIDVYLEMMFDEHCTQSFMLECLRYWARVYKIDGFHINDAILSPLLLAGDPYLQRVAFLTTNLPEQISNNYPNRFILYQDEFLYDMRRYLKGDEGMVPSLCANFMSHEYAFGRLHYITDHNGFTLRDLYSYDVRHNEGNKEGGKDGIEYNFSWNCGEEGVSKKVKTEALRLKMMKNALTVLFLSAGTPMLLGGDEFGHTKSGNNNSFCQDNETSWLDWSRLRKQSELFEYTKTLIEIRKKHPIFSIAREMKQTDLLSCGWPEISFHGLSPWNVDYSGYNRMVGILLCGSYVRRADKTFEDSFYLMFNMHWEPHEFELPKITGTKWSVLLKTGEMVTTQSGSIQLEPRSIVILQSKQQNKITKK